MKHGVQALFLVSALVLFPGAAAMADWFVRGDVNANGSMSLGDAIQVLRYLFFADQGAAGCLEAADVDDDGEVALDDAVYLLTYLYLAGPKPKAPFQDCGADLTDDKLDCMSFVPCRSIGIFFCLDRSGSMFNGSKFTKLKQDAIAEIGQLSEEDQFSIVFFDMALFRFPISEQPADATTEMKASAIDLINSVSSGSGTCSQAALLRTLMFANQSTTDRKSIIFASDGYNACFGEDEAQYAKETLAAVKAANTEGVPINSICIGPTGSVDENFMKALASQNGGTYTRIVE